MVIEEVCCGGNFSAFPFMSICFFSCGEAFPSLLRDAVQRGKQRRGRQLFIKKKVECEQSCLLGNLSW